MPIAPLTFAPGQVLTDADCDRMAEATQPYTAYTPTVTNVTTSGRAAAWHRHGDHVDVDFDIVLSGALTGILGITLPVSASARFGAISGRPYVRGHGSILAGGALTPFFVVLESATTFRLMTTAGVYFTTGAPAGLGSTHIISGSLTYEAA